LPIAVTEMRGSYDVITWGHLHVYHTKYKLNFSVCCGDVYSEGKKNCTLTSLYLIQAEIANPFDPA